MAVGVLAVAVTVPGHIGATSSQVSSGRVAADVSGYMNDVSCPTVALCMAVGYEQNANGQTTGALVDDWNGSKWTRDAAGATPRVQLDSVSCVTTSWCMAVGSTSGNVASSQVWNGTKWSRKTVTGATPAYVGSVSCTSKSMCKAIGSLYPASAEPAAFIASWNGTTWTMIPAKPASTAARWQLWSVSCVAPTFCMAAGASQTRSSSTPLVEEWNGSGWRQLGVRAPSGATQLLGVDCVSTDWCAAVGAKIVNGTFSAYWNGQRWGTLAAMRKQYTYTTFSAIGCASSRRCVAVGAGAYPRQPYSYTGDIWDGHHWSLANLEDQNVGFIEGGLGGTTCPETTYCVAAGWTNGPSAFIPLIEAWNGTRWALQAAPK